MKTIAKKGAPLASRGVGLRVPKGSGERAIRILTSRELIDNSRRLEAADESLLIPLAKRPAIRELKVLREEFGDAVLIEKTFQRKISSPRTLKEALSGKLPKAVLADLPSSYDIIGDIAIIDLPSSLSQYEEIFAKGIQDVNTNVRVVLAKAGEISGDARTRPTRYLAGENRTDTVHIESGCRFNVDISKAYFSPRLSHEHERVVKKVTSDEVVTDLFSGVGPFSIMIAKRLPSVEVNAIDSNPYAITLLRENANLNKVRGRLNVWPGDARDVVRRNLSGKASRVIMNHPSAAKEFVDVGCAALKNVGGMIHYYTFAQGQDCEDWAVSEFENALAKCNWRTRWLAEVRRVREVAPMKWQVVVDAPVAPIR